MPSAELAQRVVMVNILKYTYYLVVCLLYKEIINKKFYYSSSFCSSLSTQFTRCKTPMARTSWGSWDLFETWVVRATEG